MAGDEDAGAGGQGGADVAAGSGESVGDVLHGGGDQDAWSPTATAGRGDGVELAHEVLAAAVRIAPSWMRCAVSSESV